MGEADHPQPKKKLKAGLFCFTNGKNITVELSSNGMERMSE